MAGALLGQSVSLADRRIKVDGEWRVAGSGASLPGPGQQLAAHPVQLADVAPGEAAQESAQGGWRFDYAAESAGRPAGAQRIGVVDASPPASAEATSVIILSPVLARPGARPRSRCRSTSWERPRCKAKVAGRISPALLTRRWSSKAGQSRLNRPQVWESGSLGSDESRKSFDLYVL